MISTYSLWHYHRNILPYYVLEMMSENVLEFILSSLDYPDFNQGNKHNAVVLLEDAEVQFALAIPGFIFAAFRFSTD